MGRGGGARSMRGTAGGKPGPASTLGVLRGGSGLASRVPRGTSAFSVGCLETLGVAASPRPSPRGQGRGSVSHASPMSQDCRALLFVRLSICPSVHPSISPSIWGSQNPWGGSQHQVAEPQHPSKGTAHLRQKGEAKKVGAVRGDLGRPVGRDRGVGKSYCMLWSFPGSPRALESAFSHRTGVGIHG